MYLRLAMIFLAIFIGISRIAVGVHWPADVLLFFYNCRYEQAIYLQSFLAIAVLVAGIREYHFLLIED